MWFEAKGKCVGLSDHRVCTRIKWKSASVKNEYFGKRCYFEDLSIFGKNSIYGPGM